MNNFASSTAASGISFLDFPCASSPSRLRVQARRPTECKVLHLGNNGQWRRITRRRHPRPGYPTPGIHSPSRSFFCSCCLQSSAARRACRLIRQFKNVVELCFLQTFALSALSITRFHELQMLQALRPTR